MHGWRHWAFS